MARTRRNVAVAKQISFVDLRIELGFRREVIQVTRPAHKMIHCTLGTIAIEHLNAQPEFHEARLHCAQCLNRWLCKQYSGVEITLDRHPNKIM